MEHGQTYLLSGITLVHLLVFHAPLESKCTVKHPWPEKELRLIGNEDQNHLSRKDLKFRDLKLQAKHERNSECVAE